jgi:hypothetical protein
MIYAKPLVLKLSDKKRKFIDDDETGDEDSIRIFTRRLLGIFAPNREDEGKAVDGIRRFAKNLLPNLDSFMSTFEPRMKRPRPLRSLDDKTLGSIFHPVRLPPPQQNDSIEDQGLMFHPRFDLFNSVEDDGTFWFTRDTTLNLVKEISDLRALCEDDAVHATLRMQARTHFLDRVITVSVHDYAVSEAAIKSTCWLLGNARNLRRLELFSVKNSTNIVDVFNAARGVTELTVVLKYCTRDVVLGVLYSRASPDSSLENIEFVDSDIPDILFLSIRRGVTINFSGRDQVKDPFSGRWFTRFLNWDTSHFTHLNISSETLPEEGVRAISTLPSLECLELVTDSRFVREPKVFDFPSLSARLKHLSMGFFSPSLSQSDFTNCRYTDVENSVPAFPGEWAVLSKIECKIGAIETLMKLGQHTREHLESVVIRNAGVVDAIFPALASLSWTTKLEIALTLNPVSGVSVINGIIAGLYELSYHGNLEDLTIDLGSTTCVPLSSWSKIGLAIQRMTSLNFASILPPVPWKGILDHWGSRISPALNRTVACIGYVRPQEAIDLNLSMVRMVLWYKVHEENASHKWHVECCDRVIEYLVKKDEENK